MSAGFFNTNLDQMSRVDPKFATKKHLNVYPSLDNEQYGKTTDAYVNWRQQMLLQLAKDRTKGENALDEMLGWTRQKVLGFKEATLPMQEPQLSGDSEGVPEVGTINYLEDTVRNTRNYDPKVFQQLRDQTTTGYGYGQVANVASGAPVGGAVWKGADVALKQALKLYSLSASQKFKGLTYPGAMVGDTAFKALSGSIDYMAGDKIPGPAKIALEMTLFGLGHSAFGREIRKMQLLKLLQKDGKVSPESFSLDQVVGPGKMDELGVYRLPELLGSQRGSVGAPNPDAPSLWQRGPAKLIQKGVDKIVDMPVFPSKGPFQGVSKTFGGNTLRKWFVHPMDRMDSEAGAMFQNLISSKQQIQNSLGNLALKMDGLSLADREVVLRVLKDRKLDYNKLPQQLKQLMGREFREFEIAVTQSATRMAGSTKAQAKVKEDLIKGIAKIYKANMDDPLWQVYRTAGARRFDLDTVKGTRAFLTEISESAESETITRLADDLLRMSAKTGEELARVTKGSLENALVRRVKTHEAWARPRRGEAEIHELGAYADDGYKWITASDKLESRALRKLKGFEIREDVAEGFLDFEKVYSEARHLVNMYYYAPWKTAKVLWNPAARVRDLASNFIFNDVGGAHPLSILNVKHYGKSLREMQQGDKHFLEFLRQTGGSFENLMNIDAQPILQSLKNHGSVPQAILGMIYNPMKTTGLKGTPGKIADAALNAPAKYTHYMSDRARFADMWAKYAKYRWNVSKGMMSKDATIDALRTVGDYNRQTQAIKFVRDWFMPFFGWQAHAVKTMGAGMINHPVRTGKYFALPIAMQLYAIDKLDMSEEDWQYFKVAVPEYMKETVFGVPTHIPLPYRDEKGRIQMADISWWIPGLQDLGEFQKSAGNVAGLIQNPAFTVGAALMKNKSFSGAPIYQEWDSPGMKAKKTALYIWQQHSPSFVYKGHLWNNAERSMDADANAPTALQAVGPLIGYRVKGIDPEAAMEAREQQFIRYEAEATRQLNQELDRAGDDDPRAEKAFQNYQDTLQRLDKQRDMME